MFQMVFRDAHTWPYLAREAQSHYVFNTNMPSSCFNLPPNSEIKPPLLWHDPEMSNDSRVVSKDGQKLCEEQTCWHQQSATNDSIHIHKAQANLKQWHQFPKGQLACCFFLLVYLLSNSEMGIYSELGWKGWILSGHHNHPQRQPILPL